ncbi:type I CRISPR-associated protein Cas7 [Psychrobacter sp. I-STPA10]|uniref:type I CRISPR-associated protein Cas7 n=1 Tax=Psychrobacter sp. I-STPA10 TaxID=2585769 RepID=UPI001E5E7904|nr:type I CRISPR-associated protein Cas7 [Psychrobacter sp. I-STPA10]
MSNAPFNRYAGLIIIQATMSNPNGDPDMESEPRMRELDGLGLISPPSVKRKYRELIDESMVMREARNLFKLDKSDNDFQILEKRGRDRSKILALDTKDFKQRYWDARLFGNTFLEKIDDKDEKQKKRKADGELEHFTNTGVLQLGVGLSVAPIQIERMTFTNKSGVESGKDRGMAPLAFRVVTHGIYCIPFYINPSVALKTGATQEDVDLFQFVTPHIYAHTTSAIRPNIDILHAWCAEHKSPLGSCPEHLLMSALKPRLKEGVSNPTSLDDYIIPNLDSLGDLAERFNKIEDLTLKSWN